MFSDELVDQLSQFIIRPHRQIYGLDKLGPKKLIVKTNMIGTYIQIYRQQFTILSEGKKIQLSVFQPYSKISQSQNILQNSQNLSKSMKTNNSNQSPPNINTNQITIFLHTNSGSRLEGLQYSKYLLQNQHIVCIFDYSGSGVSEGQYVSMGLNQAKDLNNVVRFLQQKFGVEKVNLWGRSMGAVTAVLYSARNSKNVKKMVLDSPFCSFRQLVKEIVNSRTGLPQFLFGVVLGKIQQNIKKKLNVNLMDIDLKQQIIKPGMQKIPIFFLISKDDKLVKPSHVQTLYQLHGGYKKLQYLQGSHNKPRPSQIRQQCAQFLCNRINNVSSQKTIQGNKKHYINIMSRKYSSDSASNDKKTKGISSSFILNASLGQNMPVQFFTNNSIGSDIPHNNNMTGNSNMGANGYVRPNNIRNNIDSNSNNMDHNMNNIALNFNNTSQNAQKNIKNITNSNSLPQGHSKNNNTISQLNQSAYQPVYQQQSQPQLQYQYHQQTLLTSQQTPMHMNTNTNTQMNMSIHMANPTTPTNPYYNNNSIHQLASNSSYNSNSNINQSLFLNLMKKNRIERPETQQSSAVSTPRDDHSLNKYSTTKISLSQLKKAHSSGNHPNTNTNTNNINTNSHINSNNFNGNDVQLPKTIALGAYKNHVDFKKQSKTMAIQYKNKIKQHINKI